jgi:NADH dehydrogenase
VNVPFGLAKIQGAFMSLLPGAPLTRDQVETLKHDSMVGARAFGLADLGVTPTAMELIVPAYLERYRAGDRFADRKRA